MSRGEKISEGKEDRSVPGKLIGFVGILNSPPDVTKQVIGFVHIVSCTKPHACRSRGTVAVGSLVEQLGAKLQLWKQLIGDDPARQAEILRSMAADHAAAATKGGPSTGPVFLDPYRDQQ